MTFKVDENLPAEAVAILRQAGFDADSIADENLSGAVDQEIAARLQEEGRILLTLDLDFSNIQAYGPSQYPGMIVLRLKHQDKPTALSYVRRIVAALDGRSPDGQLWIVEQDRIRFRGAS